MVVETSWRKRATRVGFGSSIAWTVFMSSLCLRVDWNVSKQAHIAVTGAISPDSMLSPA